MKCESWIKILAASDEKIQPAAAPTRLHQTARNDNPRRRRLHRRAAFRYKIVRVKTDKTVLAVSAVAAATAAAVVVVAEVAEVIVIPVANPEERGQPSHMNNWSG